MRITIILTLALLGLLACDVDETTRTPQHTTPACLVDVQLVERDDFSYDPWTGLVIAYIVHDPLSTLHARTLLDGELLDERFVESDFYGDAMLNHDHDGWWFEYDSGSEHALRVEVVDVDGCEGHDQQLVVAP